MNAGHDFQMQAILQHDFAGLLAEPKADVCVMFLPSLQTRGAIRFATFGHSGFRTLANEGEMRNPLAQRKKNRFLSAVEYVRLSIRNRCSAASVRSADGPVVSLTTYGPRLKQVFVAIEAIARGTRKPSRLILWLDEEMRGKAVAEGVASPSAARARGPILRKFRPHNKCYPFVDSESVFVRPLVTADDDVIYPDYWLDELMAAFGEEPNLINCFRAQRSGWRLADCSLMRRHGAQSLHHAKSPSILYRRLRGRLSCRLSAAALKRAGPEFKTCCPRADDIWLNVIALRCGYKVRQIRTQPIHFVEIMGTQRSSLNRSNVQAGGNDRQLGSTYGPVEIALLQDALRLENASCPAR